MRIFISFLFSFLAFAGFSQQVGSLNHNFGKVKEWNNPIFTTTYTNTSGQLQFFLPTNYSADYRINFEKDMLQPGESTTVQMQYFTEEFGRFSKQIKVYISSQDDPLIFTLSGHIVSIDPSAFTMCPRIENVDLGYGGGFNHNVKVLDAATKEPVRDFEITILTDNSTERFKSSTSQVILRRERPDRYTFEIDKEEYKIAKKQVYVNRNTAETVIYLEREKREDSDYFDFDKSEDTPLEEVITATTVEETLEETMPIVEDEPDVIIAETTPTIPEVITSTNIPEDEELIEEEVITSTVDKPKETPPSVTPPKPAPEVGDFTTDGLLTSKYAFNHIIFLIDVSGSMNHETKLPLLKYSMYQMINVLRPEDRVSIITYSTEPTVLVRSISGANKDVLKEAIGSLEAKGQSFGSDGVQVAYDIANDNFIPDGNNEIILASDGVFTMENEAVNTWRLERNIAKQMSDNNIRLSSIGFGKAKNALSFLHDLSDKGEGSFITIKSEEQAQTILIENMMKHSEIR